MNLKQGIVFSFAIIVILFGLAGILGDVYFYINFYPKVQTQINNTSNELILASQNLEDYLSQPIVGPSFSNKLASIQANLESLNTNIESTQLEFQSIGSAFNMCILGVCPFNSISNFFFNAANTIGSASQFISSASTEIGSISNITLSSLLNSNEDSLIISTSNQLYSIGENLKQISNYFLYLFLYFIAFNLMFVLIGFSIIILSNMKIDAGAVKVVSDLYEKGKISKNEYENILRKLK